MNLFDLTGKVAVITGSSKGIGRAIAERMADHGAKVVISSRKPGPCDEVAAAINAEHPGAAIAVPANISSKDDLQRLVDETRKAFGKIDILVCNAASNPYFGPMAGIADDQFRKILDNNIVANHWLISMVAPEMVERNDGAVVIVSSIGGLRGTPVLGAYGISKAADMQLARNLAVEYGPHNVRVNCIAPGLIRTDFARALWENPAILKRSTENTPLQRIGEPDEIAGVAVFLASSAGSFTTGQTLVVDGGQDHLRADAMTDTTAETITDSPPDRLSANPRSPFYDEAVLQRGVGVRFKGVEKTNVDEYCISEGWVRLTVGKTTDRTGAAMTVKLQGAVEAWFKSEGVDG